MWQWKPRESIRNCRKKLTEFLLKQKLRNSKECIQQFLAKQSSFLAIPLLAFPTKTPLILNLDHSFRLNSTSNARLQKVYFINIFERDIRVTYLWSTKSGQRMNKWMEGEKFLNEDKLSQSFCFLKSAVLPKLDIFKIIRHDKIPQKKGIHERLQHTFKTVKTQNKDRNKKQKEQWEMSFRVVQQYYNGKCVE